jgi:hypothetical protein
MKRYLLLTSIILLLALKTIAATVDTIVIASKVMNKSYKAVIALPHHMQRIQSSTPCYIYYMEVTGISTTGY